MSKFKDNPCPFCGKAFADDDDIIVCPDCGTPHHRECYAENGKCCNALLHESGFVWKSVIENAISGYMELEDKEISDDSRWKAFTETHGKNMDLDKLNSFRKFFDTVEKRRENLDRMKERFEARDIYGVSEHEIVSFQSTGNPFVIERYRKIANTRNPVSFNILAGFLNPIYSFYFRALPIGIVLAAVNFILYVPNTLKLYYYWSMFKNVDTIELLQRVYDRYSAQITAAAVSVIILTCVFFDYFYLRWMAGKIKNIRARFEAELKTEEPLGKEYYTALSHAGRPRVIKGLIDNFLTWAALSVILFFVLGMAGVV